jgi:LCP family protein required for cell wall assembly
MAILVLGVSGAGYALLSYSEHRIKRVDVFGGLTHRPGKQSGDAVNYLVVGSDKREGLTPAQLHRLQVGRATADNGSGQRSDTMMLVHVAADREHATIISLPRDSYVEIPAHQTSGGKQVPASHNKLNAAFAFGGPQLLIQTVEQATGVRIDHYVEVNFAGFVGMVDALNGVDICVPKAVKDAKAHLNLSAGNHHLDGVESLKYVRARYFDGQGDLGRMRRQQQFIGAMLREATSAGVLLNPVKLTSFVNAALDSVETDPGLSRDDVIQLARQLRDIAAKKVAFVTVPISNQDYRPPGRADVGSTVLWDDNLATQLFSDIKADKPVAPDTGKAKPTVSAEVPPSQVKVKVLNAAGTKGLAGRAADDFAKAGFSVVGSPGNAPQQNLETTVIRYDPRWSRSVKTVQAALPGATLQQVKGLGGTFEVYLGSSYSGLTKVTLSTPSPSSSSSSGGTIVTHTAAESACGG